MTAITINLLAEEQQAEQAEARDPVKVTAAIGIGVVAVCVLAGAVLSLFVDRAKTQADILEAKWSALSATQSAVTGNDFKSLKAKADEIISINRGRQLFAQQLAFIKDLVPITIQLSRIDFAINVDVQGAPPADAGGVAGGVKPLRVAKPKSVEHVSLTLNGRATCARPEIEVDEFIRILREKGAFGSQVNSVKLTSISRSQVSGELTADAAPTAVFVIECRYKEHK